MATVGVKGLGLDRVSYYVVLLCLLLSSDRVTCPHCLRLAETDIPSYVNDVHMRV